MKRGFLSGSDAKVANPTSTDFVLMLVWVRSLSGLTYKRVNKRTLFLLFYKRERELSLGNE